MTSAAATPRNSVRRALSLSFTQTIVSVVFTFGAVVIVSHILTPAEIGIYSVAAGLVALIHMLRDFGVSQFLIQEKELDESLIRTVFTINLAITWGLAAALFACSGPVGAFYGNVGVARVLRVISMVFVLMPFGVVAQALMRRDLEFGKLFWIWMGENITRACSLVLLAYLGFSYMSMAWGALVGIAVMVAGCTVWGWDYRVKGLSFKHWRRVLHFGSSRTIADIARQVGDQSANLVIGRMLGMVDTGLYSRGYGVVNLYNDRVAGAIGNVAFPAFAREQREQGSAAPLYLKSLTYTSGLSWPFFAAGVLLAQPIIRILFGPQWDAAVPLMRWLCGAAMVAVLTNQCGVYLIASGRVHDVTRVELKYQVIRVAISITAAFYSVTAVAAAQTLVYVMAAWFYYRTMFALGGLTLRGCMQALVPSIGVAAATCVAPVAVVSWPGLLQRHMVEGLSLAIAGGCLGWWLAVRVFRHPLLGEMRGVLSRYPVLSRVVCGC